MILFNFSKFIEKIISWILKSGTKILAIFVVAYFTNFFFQKIIKKAIIKGIRNGIQEEEKRKELKL